MIEECFDIVCMNNDGFDGLRRPRHILMQRLARAGHRVLFVSPASKSFTARRGKKILPLGGLARIEENLHWWQPPVVFRAFYRRPLNIVSLVLRTMALRTVIRYLGLRRPVIFVSAPDGDFLQFIKEHPSLIVIYNVHDRFLDAHDQWIPGHDYLLQRANIVLCGSKFIMNEVAGSARGEVYMFSPALDELIFLRSTPTEKQNDSTQKYRPLIGCVGNFGIQIDWGVVDQICNQPYDYVFVGPVMDSARSNGFFQNICRRSNVKFIGAVQHEEVPSFVARFDVCIIPYVLDEYTKGINSLKLLEFFAMGKPVVASPIPSMVEYEGAVKLAITPSEWQVAIAEALTEDNDEVRLCRRAIVELNTYSAKANDFVKMVHRLDGVSDRPDPTKNVVD